MEQISSHSHKTQRIQGLDGLRGVAVMMVFLHHTGLVRMYGGFIGVDIFFVLSGFLITKILADQYSKFGKIDFLAFYFRRALRLSPALIFLLLAVTLYGLTINPSLNIKMEVLPAFFYVMNWIRAFDIFDASMTGHTWSLAIEEQFYLLLPLFLSFSLVFFGSLEGAC